MRRTRRTGLILAPFLVIGSAVTAVGAAAPPAAADGTTRQIPSAGVTTPRAAGTGNDAIQWPEFPGGGRGEPDAAAASARATASRPPARAQGGPAGAGRSLTSRRGAGATSSPGARWTRSNPTVGTHFDGLNFREQRLANGGNQFSIEPPDQGLCVGNGFVVESTNSVLRIFDKAGAPLTGVVDLNTFYGYPAAIDRTTGAFGPELTDPSCYYDSDTHRWFHAVLTLDTDPAAGDFTGPNHIDIAVSSTDDPTGSWRVYKLPVQDDGTEGTPDHHCEGGPCIGDYPHIGADAHGFFVSTNEYPFFADSGYIGSQLYAFSKRALARGDATVSVTQIDTSVGSGHDLAGTPGFTIWPAQSAGGAHASAAKGTEYFLSSTAAEEANGTGTDRRIGLWALSNTASLETASPAVVLHNQVLPVGTYSVPPRSNQKAGDFPLGQCLNDVPCSTFLLGAPDPFVPETLSDLDSNDSRMQQVVYANGMLWGALDTGVRQGSTTKAGVAWFIVAPFATPGRVAGLVLRQGQLSLPGNNVIYPAVAALDNGRGVMSFTVVGTDHYPSVGYAGIDVIHGVGDVHIVQEGVGPQDGFSGYRAFAADPDAPRPRWGDYGAAVADGSSIWFAAEYIGQTCTLAEYETTPFGSCGGTRATLGNWATHITSVKP